VLRAAKIRMQVFELQSQRAPGAGPNRPFAAKASNSAGPRLRVHSLAAHQRHHPAPAEQEQDRACIDQRADADQQQKHNFVMQPTQ
jgi:hypothetical protein